MKIVNQTFDDERAFYGSFGEHISNCRFQGPKDGESAFKESSEIRAENCLFDLRYPFWHCHKTEIKECTMTEHCRAALWYSSEIHILNTQMHGIKALRECSAVRMKGSDIRSPEFGWFSTQVHMEDCAAESEYFMMRSEQLNFRNVQMKGKYSFQYIIDSIFEDCFFDTKDAFWHAKNVTVKNSVIKGEYLAWYSENITFENCKIIGTQPLCYCKGLKLINCEMIDADLAFEKSEVTATLTAPVISIKNPLAGEIVVPSVTELITDGKNTSCRIVCLKS